MNENRMKSSDSDHTAQYEKSDVDTKKLFLTAFIIILVIITVIITMNEIFMATKEHQIYESVLSPESTDWRELEARETEALYSYKVIDEKRGIYQIPIKRAMEVLADEAFQKKVDNK